MFFKTYHCPVRALFLKKIGQICTQEKSVGINVDIKYNCII